MEAYWRLSLCAAAEKTWPVSTHRLSRWQQCPRTVQGLEIYGHTKSCRAWGVHQCKQRAFTSHSLFNELAAARHSSARTHSTEWLVWQGAKPAKLRSKVIWNTTAMFPLTARADLVCSPLALKRRKMHNQASGVVLTRAHKTAAWRIHCVVSVKQTQQRNRIISKCNLTITDRSYG